MAMTASTEETKGDIQVVEECTNEPARYQLSHLLEVMGSKKRLRKLATLTWPQLMRLHETIAMMVRSDAEMRAEAVNGDA